MTDADQILIQREASVQPADATLETTLRSILFYVHEDDELDNRMQCALSLARGFSAHLELLQIVPIGAYTVVDTHGGTFISGEIAEAINIDATAVRNRLEEHLRKEDVNWTFEALMSATLPELTRAAALSDLVVIGRRPLFSEWGVAGPSLLAQLVRNGRTPLCVPGDGTTRLDPFGRAVIAWNGSIESANAVRAAIGLLRVASDVRVIRYIEDDDVRNSDMRLLQYLSRHDIHAEIETHRPRSDPATELIEYAARCGAEYVVMGAYSHSRAGEFIFGGITRDLLQACSTTLVMSH